MIEQPQPQMNGLARAPDQLDEHPSAKRRRIEDIIYRHSKLAYRIRRDLDYVLKRANELQEESYALAYCDRIMGLADMSHRLSNDQWQLLTVHHSDLLRVFHKVDGMTYVLLHPRGGPHTLARQQPMVLVDDTSPSTPSSGDDAEFEDEEEEDELIPNSVTELLTDEEEADEEPHGGGGGTASTAEVKTD